MKPSRLEQLMQRKDILARVMVILIVFLIVVGLIRLRRR